MIRWFDDASTLFFKLPITDGPYLSIYPGKYVTVLPHWKWWLTSGLNSGWWMNTTYPDIRLSSIIWYHNRCMCVYIYIYLVYIYIYIIYIYIYTHTTIVPYIFPKHFPLILRCSKRPQAMLALRRWSGIQMRPVATGPDLRQNLRSWVFFFFLPSIYWENQLFRLGHFQLLFEITF